jgi:hypothetical protein
MPNVPRLKADDREDLSDAKLLLSSSEGNVRAALIGEDLEDALRNAEKAAEQALNAIRRVRGRVVGP